MFQASTATRLVATALALGASAASAQTFTQGPSSSATPYLNNSGVPTLNAYAGNSNVATASGPVASFTSILTVGDAGANTASYKMAGIPDGLGAFDNGNGTFTVVMNHEIATGLGGARGPLTSGAFVSQWVVNKSDLSVVSGQNAITSLNQWNYNTQSYTSGGTTSFSRFCSGDLAAASAFYNANTGLGYNGGRIFMTGEESGTSGRALATVVSGSDAGQLFQLPSLGRLSFENAVANPFMQNKTIVAATDDTSGSGNGKVYIYVGNKQAAGNVVEMAGLHGGTTYAVAVNGTTQESRNSGVGASSTSFSLVALPDQKTVTSNTNAAATTAGGTSFLRPEDISWDPTNHKRAYFTTTDQIDTVKDATGSQTGRSRVWSLTFNDLADPTAGGVIDLVIDGTGPGNMFDNLTVDGDGNLILQEDVGGNAHLGKVWKYDVTSHQMLMIASHDPARFGNIGVSPTSPFNNDEESSGVIDVTALFTGVAGYDTSANRYYLLDSQAHYAISGEAVEGGQLLLMSQPVPEPEGGALMLAGLGAVGLAARRRKPGTPQR